MGTVNHTVHTLGMAGMGRDDLNLLGAISGAEVALDIRPEKGKDDATWISRYLRWSLKAEPSIVEVHHVPDLHEWADHPDLLRRAVATVRKYRNVLIVCACEGACARTTLAERIGYFIDGLTITDLDPYRRPPIEGLPREGMNPNAVQRWLADKNYTEALLDSPEANRLRDEALAGVADNEILTIQSVSDTLRKRTVTGAFRGIAAGKVLLLDGNNRVQRMPIERITSITAFDPFAGEEAA